MKVLSVIGTRPEAIKMAPVIKAFESDNYFQSFVCVTGQHKEMLENITRLFDIRKDFDLEIMRPNQDLFDITANVVIKMRDVLQKVNPDMVIVQGDTTTAMTAALSAFYCKIPVGHVEAGLRTNEKYAPYPEEINRRLVSAIADIHWAPTQRAQKNLLKEGIPGNKVIVTGNTVIDALFMALKKVTKSSRFPELADIEEVINSEKDIVLITGHRRENFGKGFEEICEAIEKISSQNPDIHLIYPVHYNPNVKDIVFERLSKVPNIHLINPVGYLEFVFLMHRSKIILTDSGGIQEEAPSLGKPVVVMRESTERPEGVEAGVVILAGANCKNILENVNRLLNDKGEYDRMSKIQNPYGDGLASHKIVSSLKK